MQAFSFSTVPFDTDAGRAALADPSCGGYASFEGWVRDHNEGRQVRRLEYEAFATLAVAERQYERAARLFGAADAQRARSGLVPQAADHPALRAIMAATPDFTGPAIDAARREGRTLSFDAAIALALESA